MYSPTTPPTSALLLSFRHVDVLVGLERCVMLDMKQRERQVGHEHEHLAFWYTHSLLASLIFVLAQRANCHVVDVVFFEEGQRHRVITHVFFFLIIRVSVSTIRHEPDRFLRSRNAGNICCRSGRFGVKRRERQAAHGRKHV